MRYTTGSKALAMGYGILFATPLTLVLLPCLLLIQGDLGRLIRIALPPKMKAAPKDRSTSDR